jgi:hypothetical protein
MSNTYKKQGAAMMFKTNTRNGKGHKRPKTQVLQSGRSIHGLYNMGIYFNKAHAWGTERRLTD